MYKAALGPSLHNELFKRVYLNTRRTVLRVYRIWIYYYV